jgi:hypothetical protein
MYRFRGLVYLKKHILCTCSDSIFHELEKYLHWYEFSLDLTWKYTYASSVRPGKKSFPSKSNILPICRRSRKCEERRLLTLTKKVSCNYAMYSVLCMWMMSSGKGNRSRETEQFHWQWNRSHGKLGHWSCILLQSYRFCFMYWDSAGILQDLLLTSVVWEQVAPASLVSLLKPWIIQLHLRPNETEFTS